MTQRKYLPPKSSACRAFIAWGLLSGAVALSAIPIVNALRTADAPEPATANPLLPGASGALSDTRIVVDLRDDASARDIAELSARFHIDLRASASSLKKPGHNASNILHADLKPGQDMDALLAALKADPRVEAAEPDVRFAIPEDQANGSARYKYLARVSAPDCSTSTSGIGPGVYCAGDNIYGPGLVAPTKSRAARTWGASSPGPKPKPKPRRGWTPNDEMYPLQWNFRMVGAEQAWKRTHGEGVVVAVLDTGVAAGPTKKEPRARDFSETEFVPGYNFIDGDEDAYDGHGHGTHVAGTIAESTNNREGAAGLAFEASIMPVKVLSDDGFGSSEGIAQGIRWAVDNGANIMNLSLGSPFPSEVIERAVRYARRHNVLVVCAAGNGFGEPVGYPAAFKGALAVSSVGPSGEMAFYSSYGPQVALAAPGGDRQAEPENGGVLQNTVTMNEEGELEDGYFQFQGTSMASPHVAAVGALLWSQGVHDASRVRDLLLRSATPKGPRLQFGAGVLSADKATSLARRWGWASMLKAWIWAFLVLPLAWKKPRTWWSPAAWGVLGSWWLRPVLGVAFWVGAFGPDWIAAFAGANSPMNLLAFSALAPAIVFWKMPDTRGSRITLALAAGTSLCLLASTWGGLLSPFTGTAVGWAMWPWVLTNLFASATIAGASWLRSQSTLR